MSQDEKPHEKHNRIGVEIAAKILFEFPNTAHRLIVLESVISGVIKLMTKSPEAQLAIFEVLQEGILERFKETSPRKMLDYPDQDETP